MCVCMCGWMDVCMHVCMCLYVIVLMYVCIFVSLYAWMHVCVHAYVRREATRDATHSYVWCNTFMSRTTHLYVSHDSWLIHPCNMTRTPTHKSIQTLRYLLINKAKSKLICARSSIYECVASPIKKYRIFFINTRVFMKKILKIRHILNTRVSHHRSINSIRVCIHQ